MIISASSDRTLKIWDLRNTQQGAVSTLKFGFGVEDFTSISADNMQLMVANGGVMSHVKISEDTQLSIVREYHAFQKPIMKIRYDAHRQRVIAGGLDNQLKFFSL